MKEAAGDTPEHQNVKVHSEEEKPGLFSGEDANFLSKPTVLQGHRIKIMQSFHFFQRNYACIKRILVFSPQHSERIVHTKKRSDKETRHLIKDN